MTVVPALAVALMLVDAASAMKSQMTYQEAASAAQAQSQDSAVVAWEQESLAPLFEKELKTLLETCLKSVSETEATSARIVAILDRDRVDIAFDPEGPEAFTACITNGLRRWNWPSPPKHTIYFPLTLNIRTPDPAQERGAAEQVIRDLAPSNNSLERTRDR